MQEDGTFDVLPKKEVIKLKKELDKLEKNLGGIKNMKKIPDAIFVVDRQKDLLSISNVTKAQGLLLRSFLSDCLFQTMKAQAFKPLDKTNYLKPNLLQKIY